MKTVYIYFSDLNDEAKMEVLEAAGISSPQEANWDIVPLAELSFGDE